MLTIGFPDLLFRPSPGEDEKKREKRVYPFRQAVAEFLQILLKDKTSYSTPKEFKDLALQVLMFEFKLINATLSLEDEQNIEVCFAGDSIWALGLMFV